MSSGEQTPSSTPLKKFIIKLKPKINEAPIIELCPAPLIDLTILKNSKQWLIFDLEWDKWRTIYQISWIIANQNGVVERHCYDIIGVKIGYTHFQRQIKNRLHVSIAKARFLSAIDMCDIIISHNLSGDLSVLIKNKYINADYLCSKNKSQFCTMKTTRLLVQAKNINDQIKYPKLCELYEHLFGHPIINSELLHNADMDCEILYQCVLKLTEGVMPSLELLPDIACQS